MFKFSVIDGGIESTVSIIDGVVEIDPYRLPPMIKIKGATLQETVSVWAHRADRHARRWLAASIILGQPFA